MRFGVRLQSLAAWKGEVPFTYKGPEPVCDRFSVKYWDAVNASLELKAMLEELLVVRTEFPAAARLLVLNDFTAVVLNDLRRGGTTPGTMLEVEFYVLGPRDVAIVVMHDAVPDLPDRDVEDGTAAHVGYDESGRCCFLHFLYGKRI